MINYCFNNIDNYCTLLKNHKILLRKTEGKIHAIKKVKIPGKKSLYYDQTHIHSGYISVNSVANQLANIGHIVFEVTDACNLQCTYCTYRDFYNDYDPRKNQYMDINKAKMLIDFVIEKLKTPANRSPKKTVYINFYGGEPLLNMKFITEIVSHTEGLKNDRIAFRYAMTTNGVLLRKNLNFLIQYDFNILVSLDGSKEHNAHRLLPNAKSSFDMVFGNILYIRDYYPIFFERNIMFNTVLHNLNNRQEVFSFFQRAFDKVTSFAKVSDTGVKPSMKKQFDTLVTPKQELPDNQTEVEMEKVMGLSYDKNRKIQQFLFKYSGNKYNDYNSLLFKRGYSRYFSDGTCFPFSKKIFMTVNNKLLPCEKIGHQFSLGKVTDHGVDINCEEVAQKFNNYCDALKKLCVRCYHAGCCSKCMFGIKNLGKKPVCEKFVNKQGFDNHLQEGFEQLSQAPELYKRIMDETVLI